MVRVVADDGVANESRRHAISRRLRASDGITIATDSIGDADAPTVVFAHGFGQTRHAWTTTATDVANKGWRSITADARGHGDSGWRDDGAYDFQQFVDDLVLVARDAR